MATNTIIKTLPEAPQDGNQYVRQDAQWAQVSIPTVDLGFYDFSGSGIYHEYPEGNNKIVMYSNNVGENLQVGSAFNTTEIGKPTGSTTIYGASVTLPSLTTTAIDSADNNSAVTKEWVLANAGTGDVGEAPLTGLSFVRNNGAWVQPQLNLSGQSATSLGLNVLNTSAANAISIPSATTSLAGLMSATDKTTLDSLSSASTNLGVSTSDDSVEITNSAGTNATINAATTSLAGVMTSADKQNINTNNAKVGIPSGGTTGQFLSKSSDTNYDVEWVDQSLNIDNYVLNVPTVNPATAINTFLDTVPKNLNGCTMQIFFNSASTYNLEVPVYIERFYNGSIRVLGTTTAPGVQNTSISNNAIFFKKLPNIELSIEYLDFGVTPSLGNIENVKFYQCSFNNTYPQYAKYGGETPVNLYNSETSYISIINSYYYNVNTYLFFTSPISKGVIADVINCTSDSKVGNITNSPSYGITKIYYNGFEMSDLVTNTDIAEDNIFIYNVNANSIYSVTPSNNIEINFSMIYNVAGNIPRWGLKVDGTTVAYYYSFKEVLDKVDANLNGGRLYINFTHTAEGDMYLDYDVNDPNRAGINLSKFHNGNILLKGTNAVTPADQAPIYINQLLHYFITVSATVNLDIENMNFICPVTNTTIDALIGTSVPVDGAVTPSNGLLSASNCTFDVLNAAPSIGAFSNLINRASFYDCTFIKDGSDSNTYLFNDVDETRPDTNYIEYNFVDCNIPSTPANIFKGIVPEPTGGYVPYGYIRVTGETGFIGATLSSKVRRTDYA